MNKILILLCLTSFLFGYSQENKFSRSSIKTGLGLGFNLTNKEEGIGTCSMIGYERSYEKKERLRMNASLILGGFISAPLVDHTREIYYITTSWNVNANYDVLKHKAASLFFYSGVFINYSRGKLGSGTNEATGVEYESERFAKIYPGVNLGLGIRINPPQSRCAFEIKPINLQFGNDGYVNFYNMFGVDIKILN
jgi:hypothetical protein